MRIIIRHCSPWGNFTTHGFDMEGLTDIAELQDKILEKFSIPKKLQILRYKRDGVTLKLIPGWSLDFYGVKDKSIIFLEKFEFQKEEDDYKQRSYIAKGGYFAKLGILTKVEEEDEEEENAGFGKKTSKMQKESISITQFASRHGSNFGSHGASNPGSDSPSDTIISSDDETSFKKSNGELYKDKKGPKQLEERERLIKAVKGNSLEKLKEVFALYDEDPEKDIKICKLIDENSYGGWNLLHWAVYLGYGELVTELIRLGANINIVSADGWTPLQLSAHTNHLEVAKLLVRDPLRIELDKVTSRMTALHIAAKNGKPELVALLLQQGADFKIKNEQDALPADLTTNEKVKQLIEYTARKRAIEEFSPPKPPIVKGYMYKRGDYLFKLNKRYFVLNPEEGTLIRYASKEDCPNKPMEIIPLKSIEGARRMNAGQFYDKNLCYIQLLYQRRHILACHNEAIANQWVMYIIQGAVYTNFLEQNIEKEVTKSMAGGTGSEIASYFGRVTDEIELDDIPSKKDGLNMRSQAPVGKSDTTTKTRQTSSFQDDRTPPVKKQEEQKKVEKIEKVQAQEIKPTLEDEDALLEVFDEKVNFQSFQILKVLGSGAFGKVYKVKKKDNKKIYAMKALRKRNLILKNQLRYAVTEANVLKSTNHPFILSLHYAFQTPQYLYLIIDYCPGGDLSLHLANKGTFTEDETRFFLAELVLAIEHIHAKDIIYRDLKPENILLTHDGHIKLADFGLSKEGIGDKDTAKSFCGSPAYLSPDMLKNKGVGKAADIYGIGTVMYEMLVGESPFYSDDIPKMYQDIRKANLVIPKNLSDAARNLLSKLLDRDPNQRPGVKNKNDMRNHPFFAGLDWGKLERKELPPPSLDPLDADEIEMPINTNHPFVDLDYDESNKFSNRVKQFTFVNKG